MQSSVNYPSRRGKEREATVGDVPRCARNEVFEDLCRSEGKDVAWEWWGSGGCDGVSHMIAALVFCPLGEVLCAAFRVTWSPEKIVGGEVQLPDNSEEKVCRGGPWPRRGVESVVTGTLAIRDNGHGGSRMRREDGFTQAPGQRKG